MRWSEEVFLFDMTSFVPYWRDLARIMQTDVLSLWKKTIDQSFGEGEPVNEHRSGLSTAVILPMSARYQGAFADHPWKAVLLLSLMKERRITGLVDAKQSLAASLFRGMSWDLWWREIKILSDHYEQAKIKIFKKPVFKNQCDRLKNGMQKLRLSVPSDMRRLPYEGFRKRYGSIFADIWRWTFAVMTAEEKILFDDGFPWHGFKAKEKPSVTRRLDDIATSWEHLSKELCDDFDKLASLMHEREKVLSLTWNITSNDLSIIQVEIKFRNPHFLISEMGSHKTALLQGHYAFNDAMQQCTHNANLISSVEQGAMEARSGFYMPVNEHRSALSNAAIRSISNWQYVVGWTLSIDETLYSPPIADFIFKSLESNADLSSLIQLENELPVPIFRYSLLDDWSPEHSYAQHAASVPSYDERTSSLFASLKAAAEARPLYIYKKPISYGCDARFIQGFAQKDETHSGRGFAQKDRPEEVANKWWLSSDEQNYFNRRYQKYCDDAGKELWIFRVADRSLDRDTKWYKHGIFG